MVTNIDTQKNKRTTWIFLTPEVHNIINSFSSFCLTIKIVSANKKESGINFVNIPIIFKVEYWKYVKIEWPLSTIKSKKFTALTVQAIIVSPNNIVRKILMISPI